MRNDVDISEITRWCDAHGVVVADVDYGATYVMLHKGDNRPCVLSGYDYYDPWLVHTLNIRDSVSLHHSYIRLPIDVFIDRVRRWANEQ